MPISQWTVSNLEVLIFRAVMMVIVAADAHARDDGRRPTQSRSKPPQIALVVIVVANPLMLLNRRGRFRCARHAIHRNL